MFSHDPTSHVPKLRSCVAAGVLPIVLLTGCDSAIEPPDEVTPGAIRADITYVGTWPPFNQFVDHRFVAMRFVPQDTTDFLQLNQLEFSEGLPYGVASHVVVLPEVRTGTYPFAVVARQRTQDILSWEALGIYMENQGVFQVTAGDTARVSITVDFDNPPDFP